MRSSLTRPDVASPETRSGKFLRWLCGCSLVLCLATGALWVRSVSVMDQLSRSDRTSQTTLVSANGALGVERVTAMIPDIEPGIRFAHALSSQYHPGVDWQFAGFGGGHQIYPTLDGPIRSETYTMPLWPVVVLFAVAPVLRWSGVKAGAVAATVASKGVIDTAGGPPAESKGRAPASPLAA